MGGSSRSKNKAPPVKQVTQRDATNALNGLMGQQIGVVGSVLDTLIPRGEAMMGANPGLANFMDKAGQKRDEFQEYLNAPASSLLEKLDGLLGIDRSAGKTSVKDNPMGLTDEQIAQMAKYQTDQPNYDYNSPFNINDYMRNQNFNR